VTELLPTTGPAEALSALRQQAENLFETVLQTADRETLLMLNPLLACVAKSVARRR